VRLADDLDFAVRKSIELGSSAGEWRAAQFRKLNKLAESVKTERDRLNAGRSVSSKRVTAHVPLERLEASRFIIGWPDHRLIELAQKGATIVGALPHVGIYRSANIIPEMSRDELVSSNDVWIDSICGSSPPSSEQAEVVWKKTLEEVRDGLARGPWSRKEMDKHWGKGAWRALVRFAVYQASSDKWRVIDNGRTALHNWTLEADERIHTTSVEMGAATVRYMRQQAQARLRGRLAVASSTHDMKSAFRQLPVRDEDRCLHIVAACDVLSRSWVFFELDGLAFGLGAAVLEFNRVPAHLVALARRWFAIPVVNFYDDFRLFDLVLSGLNADSSFLNLTKWSGWRFDPKKHQPPSASIRLLGIIESAEDDGEGEYVTICATEERRKSILEEIGECIESKGCAPGFAAHIVGRLIHYSTALPGRIGQGPMAYLGEHSRGTKRALNDEAIMSLEFYRELLKIKRPRRIPLTSGDYPPRVVISDASWEPGSASGTPGRVCFFLLDQQTSFRKGAVFDIKWDSPLLRHLEHRSSQIMAAELLGPMLALAFGGAFLRKASATFFMDNLSGLCAIVKGGSRRVDLAALANGIATGFVTKDCRAWIDYVESASNSTDGGSRVGVSDDMASRLGVSLIQLEIPILPKNFPFCKPSEWAAWWDELEVKHRKLWW